MNVRWKLRNSHELLHFTLFIKKNLLNILLKLQVYLFYCCFKVGCFWNTCLFGCRFVEQFHFISLFRFLMILKETDSLAPENFFCKLHQLCYIHHCSRKIKFSSNGRFNKSHYCTSCKIYMYSEFYSTFLY